MNNIKKEKNVYDRLFNDLAQEDGRDVSYEAKRLRKELNIDKPVYGFEEQIHWAVLGVMKSTQIQDLNCLKTTCTECKEIFDCSEGFAHVEKCHMDAAFELAIKIGYG